MLGRLAEGLVGRVVGRAVGRVVGRTDEREAQLLLADLERKLETARQSVVISSGCEAAVARKDSTASGAHGQ